MSGSEQRTYVSTFPREISPVIPSLMTQMFKQWMRRSASNPSTQSWSNDPHEVEDMSFDDLFEDEEDTNMAWTGSYQQ